MFLNTTTTTNPARKSLDARHVARRVASGATAALIEQTRRIRVGHVSFVLGVTLAVAAVVSLGALEADPSSRLPSRSPEMINGIEVSRIAATPVYIVLVDSQDEANALIAESYYFQTNASATVALPTVRVIANAEDDQQLQDELSMMVYHGVDYRVTDLLKN